MQFNDFKHINLSAKTLYGLADVIFYAFPELENHLYILGIKYPANQVESFIASGSRKYIPIIKLLSFDLPVGDGERKVIALGIKGLIQFRQSGLLRGNLKVNPAQLSGNIYGILCAIQQATGNCSKIMNLLDALLLDFYPAFSPAHRTITINTIKYHLKNNKKYPPLLLKINQNNKFTLLLLNKKLQESKSNL